MLHQHQSRCGLQTVAAQAQISNLDDVGPVNPFSLVTDELDSVSARMRSAVVSEVRPKHQTNGRGVRVSTNINV